MIRTHEKVDRILQDLLLFAALLVMMTFCINQAFAAPTWTFEKIDNHKAKIEIKRIVETTDEKNTNACEKTYSVKKLQDKKAQHLLAKQSWIDSQTSSELQVEANIALQQAQIDLATNIAEECQNQGICAPSDWVTGTDYAESNCVTGPDGVIYKCLIAHTSVIFTDDLAEGKWEVCT